MYWNGSYRYVADGCSIHTRRRASERSGENSERDKQRRKAKMNSERVRNLVDGKERIESRCLRMGFL